jgi:hypothetical protein
MKLLFNKNLDLLFTGIFIIIFLIWNRVIRIRLPKDIPFDLTDFRFLLLVALCITFSLSLLLTIKVYLFPNSQLNVIGVTLRTYIDESLQELDYRIRANPYIFSLMSKLSNKIFQYNHKYISYSKYIFLLFHIPKILLPIILFIDVIYFNKIALFYHMLILLIIPLIYTYFDNMLNHIYTLETYYSDQRLTIRLQTLYKDELVFTVISEATHYYTQETTLERLKIRDNDHVFHITLSEKYIQENPNGDWDTDFKLYMTQLNSFSIMFEILRTYYQLKKTYSLYINVVMISIYLICWSYVLYTGTYILSNEFLDIVKQLQDKEEPFSGLDV